MTNLPDIDILVPAKNETENLPGLLFRIHKTFSGSGVAYRVIVINDRSTDNTKAVANRLAESYPIIVHDKVGIPGKGYAILEGAKLSSAPVLAMIDADLQYPPEKLLAMYRLTKNYGIVVANRQTGHVSRWRKAMSNINRLVVAKFISGLSCDTQSGMKVFHREIIDHVEEKDITAWGVDIPLLQTAVNLGHSIGTVDITFAKRLAGDSKVNTLQATRQIISSALRIRRHKNKVYQIGDQNAQSAIGRGYIYRKKKFVTHSKLHHSHSAVMVTTRWQNITMALIAFILLIGLIFFTKLTITLFVAGITALYAADAVFSFVIIRKSLLAPPELAYSKEQLNSVKDENLPIYSILCPLYKESAILSHFVHNISKLHWPKSKLDILLLLEEDDIETIEVAKALKLPSQYRIVIVPHSFPKTKPKACNYGLQVAKGEYVVIYDAEDKPDPLQLKKAYLGFMKSAEKVGCLQAKLNYFNPKQNLLTRFFTAEYSLWFDVILPGYQSLKTALPLGGTSNHFNTSVLKQLHGWDAFNVTEDCDLGARLFKLGYTAALIDSTTYEEANSNWGNWIRQRSRWIKGYIQTFLVHNRNPLAFAKTHGIHSFFFQFVVGGKTIFTVINPLLWLTTIAYFTAYKFVGSAIESVFPPLVFYIAVLTALFGNFMYIYYYMIGCAKREQWHLIKFAFLIPLYWVVLSIAAVKAIWQLITKPYFWEKTKHGLHLAGDTKRDLSSIISRAITDLSDLMAKDSQTEPSSPKMRILIFNWRDLSHKWAGGAESYVHELGKRWVKLGHTVTLFCGNDGTQKKTDTIDGIEIIRRGGTFLIYIWSAVYYLIKLRGKFDIVIDAENGIPFFTPLYVRKPKHLLIHHIHQDSFIYAGHLRFPLAQIAMLLERVIMPMVYKNQSVITVSASSKQDIENLNITSTENISVVSPGIDTKQYKKLPKTKHPSFVYLGRIRPYKNVDIAIKAFASVKASIPNATLTIAGWGECIDQLKRLARELGVADSVKFTGRVSDKEKTKILASAWVSLQPSSIEGWGITVVESNACGTTVIASNVSGLRDSVIHNQTGLLVQDRNSTELAKAMLSLATNKTLRNKLEKNAIEWAKNFDWDVQSNKFLATLLVSQVESMQQSMSVVPAYSN